MVSEEQCQKTRHRQDEKIAEIQARLEDSHDDILLNTKDIEMAKNNNTSLQKALEKFTDTTEEALKAITGGYITKWAFTTIISICMTVCMSVLGYIVYGQSADRAVLSQVKEDVAVITNFIENNNFINK